MTEILETVLWRNQDVVVCAYVEIVRPCHACAVGEKIGDGCLGIQNVFFRAKLRQYIRDSRIPLDLFVFYK